MKVFFELSCLSHLDALFLVFPENLIDVVLADALLKVMQAGLSRFDQKSGMIAGIRLRNSSTSTRLFSE